MIQILILADERDGSMEIKMDTHQSKSFPMTENEKTFADKVALTVIKFKQDKENPYANN